MARHQSFVLEDIVYPREFGRVGHNIGTLCYLMMYIYVSISKSGCIIFYTLCVYNSSYIRLRNKSDLVNGFIKVEWHSEITKDRLRNFRDNKRRIERKRREKKKHHPKIRI